MPELRTMVFQLLANFPKVRPPAVTISEWRVRFSESSRARLTGPVAMTELRCARAVVTKHDSTSELNVI